MSLGRNNEIDAREQFVCLNSNIISLSNNFLYWNAMADYEILKKLSLFPRKIIELF